MGKVTLLFAGKSYDTDVQSVRENQIVIFDGPYNMRQRMVVAGIAHTQSGYNYRLIDPETAEEHSADLIRPLRDKFGIGHYYDDEHPEFMDGRRSRGAPHSVPTPSKPSRKPPDVRRRKTRNGYAPSARSVCGRSFPTMPWPSSSVNSMKANATPIRTISARVSCAR